jgi:hypothetical protein
MKAIFTQMQEKKAGTKVTAWWQNFLYEESCHHVYLTKYITRNGKKSTVPAFAKVTGQEVPEILTANVYFWSPGGSASWRRANELKRNTELSHFKKENRKEASEFLTTKFSESLLPGEKIGVDSLGAFLLYRGHDYHFFNSFISRKTIEQARQAIKDRRLFDIKNYREQKNKKEQFNALLPKVFVTVKDSTQAGNCLAGTLNFYNNLDIVKKGLHIRALRADALLKIRDDQYTRRAINAAIQRSMQQ